MEKLEASIIGTVFRNAENGYSVLSVRSGRSEYTVVGSLPELNPGEQAVFSGEWMEHKSYGRQFKCVSCEIQMPTTLLGIERYLASGAIRGIGPSTAALIVAHFGEETMSVLAEHPERLAEISGIGPKRASMIAESFAAQQGARQAIIFLQSYGVPAPLAIRISQFYGDRTPEVVRQDPYRLCDDLEGVGFRTADRIGLALGFAADGESRIRCALKFLLREAASGGGHCFLPEELLKKQAAAQLQVPAERCSLILSKLLFSRDLIAEIDAPGEGRRFYLPEFFRAEKEVARRLQELMAAIRPGVYAQAGRAITRFERSHGISFSSRQREAISQALETGVSEAEATAVSKYEDGAVLPLRLVFETAPAAAGIESGTDEAVSAVVRYLDWDGQQREALLPDIRSILVGESQSFAAGSSCEALTLLSNAAELSSITLQAEGKIHMDDTGYPLDFDISNDGTKKVIPTDLSPWNKTIQETM